MEPIKTEAEFDAALARIDVLLVEINAQPGTPEYEELDRLSQTVWEYEQIHYPIDPPTEEARREYADENIIGGYVEDED